VLPAAAAAAAAAVAAVAAAVGALHICYGLCCYLRLYI
jgi:hypothetical protein